MDLEKIEELLKELKAYRDNMVAKNYPFQEISDIITKWETKDFLEEVEKEKKELDLREKRMVSEAAESTWKLIQNSSKPEDFRYFLEQFPDSPYAIPAKLKLKQLEGEEQ